VALIVTFAWLAWNLVGAVTIYQRFSRQIPAAATDSMS
jgi:hypothetical protein